MKNWECEVVELIYHDGLFGLFNGLLYLRPQNVNSWLPNSDKFAGLLEFEVNFGVQLQFLLHFRVYLFEDLAVKPEVLFEYFQWKFRQVVVRHDLVDSNEQLGVHVRIGVLYLIHREDSFGRPFLDETDGQVLNFPSSSAETFIVFFFLGDERVDDKLFAFV